MTKYIYIEDGGRIKRSLLWFESNVQRRYRLHHLTVASSYFDSLYSRAQSSCSLCMSDGAATHAQIGRTLGTEYLEPSGGVIYSMVGSWTRTTAAAVRSFPYLRFY